MRSTDVTTAAAKRRAPPDPDCAVMSPEQARQYVPGGKNQFYAACRRGEIPTIRIGSRIWVLRRPFMKMLGLDDAGEAA